MLPNLFGSVLDDLTAFSPAESTNTPTVDWSTEQTIRLLQQYPSGVSRPVLLTELEHRWRMYLKRGEHVGKLKQAIVTKQLSLNDTFTGDLTAIDEYRYAFVTCKQFQYIIYSPYFPVILLFLLLLDVAYAGARSVPTAFRAQ